MTWPASGSCPGFCQLSRLSLPGAPAAPRAPEALAFTSSSESSFFEGRRWPPSRAFGDLGGDEPPPTRPGVPSPPRPVTEFICCLTTAFSTLLPRCRADAGPRGRSQAACWGSPIWSGSAAGLGTGCSSPWGLGSSGTPAHRLHWAHLLSWWMGGGVPKSTEPTLVQQEGPGGQCHV